MQVSEVPLLRGENSIKTNKLSGVCMGYTLHYKPSTYLILTLANLIIHFNIQVVTLGTAEYDALYLDCLFDFMFQLFNTMATS